MLVAPADKAGSKKALQILRRGGVVAHPTDTVFGLAVDASSPKAVRKIHAIKKTNSKKPLLIVVPTQSYLSQIAQVPKTAKALMKEFWPGALALILPVLPPSAHGGFPPSVRGVRGECTIGVRYPAHTLTLALARGLGRPITTTSANLTGQPTATSASAVFRQFAHAKHQPDLILDDSEVQKAGQSSTIIDCTAAVPVLRRIGVVPFPEIQKVLRRQSSAPARADQRLSNPA